MKNVRMLRVAAFSAALVIPSAGFSASVDIEQIILDQVFELGGAPYNNTANTTADAAEVQDDPEGLNVQDGDENKQKNISTLDPTALETNLLQKLINNSFNTGAESDGNSTVHNQAVVDINTTGELVQDVAINTAAGAFNVQINASVIAPVFGDALASSATDVGQLLRLNDALVQGVTNDVISNIVIDAAQVNVGINTVAGTGNEQINSARITTGF
jgi:hypothetical protein